jgi:GNAT superfamily N-acetyltransferase
MSTVVRVAVPADAEAMARVHVASWQFAYRGMLDDELLDGLDWRDRRKFWTRILRRPTIPESANYVIEDDGRIVGFASVGPCRDEDRSDLAQWELYALYLEPAVIGGGLGAAITDHAFANIPAHVDDLSLWVIAANDRARKFYERIGFTLDGHDQYTQIGEQDVYEVRYVRPRLT